MAYKNHASLTQSSALALATGLMFASAPVHAQSFQGESFVAEGAATITTGVDTTDISVETDSVVIDWTPFDDSGIGDVFFQDPGTTATFTNGTGVTDFAVLNRINTVDLFSRVILDGNIVSQIQDGMGGSVSGGTVFFYTPGGIVIGANATIDVGNLGLTTAAPLTDGIGNFITSDTVDFQQSEGFASIEIEQGAQINALQEGSYVALFAPRIIQNGDINVNGQAALVAAEAGTITFSPDGLFDIQVDVGTDAGFGAIEHSGRTGGPASTGLGDNHRIYMVAVAKNTAATLLIQGGSELGFDIATSASMDGEAIVLSGGYNITVGDIGPQAPSGAQTDVLLTDTGGVGLPGLLATSDVVVRADGQASGSFTDFAFFEGDLDIASGRSAVVTNGSLASLTVNGDLSIVSDTPNAGQDAGISDMRLRNGSTVNIAGDLFIASTALFDANIDGIASSATASLSVNEASVLQVGGDLVIDSGNDFSGDPINGFQVNSGVARLLLNTGSSTTVGGVTRIRSDSFAGAGGNVFTGAALVSASGGGTLVTGELSISSDAFGGDDIGSGGGSATAGNASLIANGAGSIITVLGGNTIGNAALGELDFLSAEAFAGDGTIGNGGNATSGTLELFAQDAGVITLPDDVGNPLFLRTSAIAGETAANDGTGGVGATGQVVVRVTDSAANLGRLAIRSTAMGGSALPGSAMTAGGNAGGGFTILDFDNANVTAAFDEIRIEHLAGAGSADGLGTDGIANGSNVMVDLDGSIFNVLSDLVITGLALNGDGTPGLGIPLDIISSGGEFNVDGNLSATGAAVNFTVDDGAGAFAPGVLDITGNLSLASVTSRFGSDVDFVSFNVLSGSTATVGGNVLISSNATADSDNDGTIAGGFVGLLVEGTATSLMVGGNVVLDASSDLTGGPIGLNALGGSVDLSVSQGAALTVGGATRLASNAIGAENGNATGQFVLLSVREGSSFITGELSLSSDAFGGEGVGGAGGDANAGTVELSIVQMGSELTVLGANTIGDPALGELEFLSSEAFGGHGLAGAGGAAIAGSTNINILEGASVNLANVPGSPLLIVNTAIGGDTSADDVSAGEAVSGFNRFVVQDSTVNFGLLSNLVNIAGGSAIGASQRSFGGGAIFDGNEFLVFDSDVDVRFDDIVFQVAAGSGSSDGLATDGLLATSSFNFSAENSTLDILSDFSIDSTGIGGDGQPVTSQALMVTFAGADVTIAGDVDLRASNVELSAAVNFGTGNATNLSVAGDVILMSNGPNFSNDAGSAGFQVNGGTMVDVGGDVLISALANGDLNGDGFDSAGSAQTSVRDFGSSLSIGGDLVIDASADLSGRNSGSIALGGSANLQVTDSGQFSVGGVTRLLTDALGGNGSEARAGNAQLFLLSGGVFTTDELNISADAFGGVDIGTGGGNAISGSAEIIVLQTGSTVTVNSANVTGDAALGELDFLSSEAVGGLGVFGLGGSATTGTVRLSGSDGGTIFLPSAIANPLVLINSAIGGDTEASDSSGGSSQTGDTFINLDNGTSVLGNLLITSLSRGGSAVGNAERSSGGNANGGRFEFSLFNSDVEVAFEQIVVEQVGGNGSIDGLGNGGSAFGSEVSFNVQDSTLDVFSAVDIVGSTTGGNGQNGGFAQSAAGTSFLENSAINVAGDFSIATTAEGGTALGAGMVKGGDAQSQFTRMELRNAQLTAAGEIAVDSTAIGGDAAEGTAGSATAVDVFVGLFADTIVDASAYRITSNAIGGSILASGAGTGGNANSGGATISYDDGVTDGVVSFIGDVFTASIATGGNGGENGGDGGAAISGFTEFRNFLPGQIDVGGNISALTQATGGNSSLGLGGLAESGVAALSGNQGQINVAGDVVLRSASTGGNGQTGGDATAGTVLLTATGRGIAVAGEASLFLEATGGNGIDNAITSNGGNANAGSLTVDARNNPGGTPTLITLSSLSVNISANGGQAGVTSGGENGGRGGDAFGGSGFIFGRAINGTLEVIGDTDITISTNGGFGGTGATGGDGGDALLGGIQFGTASGGAVPDQVDGSANFADVNVELFNFGGSGGLGTAGLGGNGGDARNQSVTVLGRGAAVNANDVAVTALSRGGDGGSGFGLGDGGDAVAGSLSLAVSQAFQNPGRGQMNLGSLLLEATAQGGNGNSVGASQYSVRGGISVTQADVTIGSIDINIGGDTQPDFLVEDFVNGGMIPVTVNPVLVGLDNVTLNVDTLNVVTAGEVNLFAANSAVTSRLFEITAGSFFQPDLSDPPMAAGTITATEGLVLTSITGDVATEATLTSGGQLILNSAASLVVGDLIAPDIFLSAPNGDLITGIVDSTGGSVSIQTGSPIDLGTVFAESLTAISTGGDIISSGVITVVGALVLDAAGSVLLNEVTSGSISATAQSGDIVFSGPVVAAGELVLNAAGLIQFAGVSAGSIVADSQGDILADELLDVAGTIDLDAGGSIELADISASALEAATGQFGSVRLNGATVIGTALNIGSGGAIELGEVTAGSINATALDGNVTANNSLNVTGLLDLDAAGSIELADVTAGSFTATTQVGDVIGLDPIVVTGLVDINSASNLGLGDVTAGTIIAQAGDVAQINGLWQAELINVTSSTLQLMSRALIDAGADGTINLTSLNELGVLLTDTDNSGIERFVVDAEAFSRLQAGQLVISGAANLAGSDIEIGDFDLSGSTLLNGLTIRTTDPLGDIRVVGTITAPTGSNPIDLSFVGGQFQIDSTTGGIDLLANGGAIAISAGSIAIGEAALFDALTGDETAQELFDLLSAPAVTSRPDGVLSGSSLILNATDRILVQNTGTAEIAAGLVTASGEAIAIGPDGFGSDNLLVIINAQINDGAGNVLTGDDAATAILENTPADAVFAAGSRFNGCELGGCNVGDQGEITSTVSAAISGTGSSTSAAGTGGTTGGESGAADDSGGETSGSEDASATNAGANTATNGSGSSGGGEVSVDNVDDGGGGNDDFTIEESDTGGSSDGSDGGSDESGGDADDGDADDGGVEDSEGDADDSEADDSDAEEADDSEESDETDEETDEEEAEEEEASEEEEEESEGPASGPIAPPVSIINTNTLDRSGAINDPISGSGNPALIDPDINVPAIDGNGELP